MGTSRLSLLIGGTGALVMGTLLKFRALPFLKNDTILSGGNPVPTEEFAGELAILFYVFSGFCLISSLIWWAVRIRKTRA